VDIVAEQVMVTSRTILISSYRDSGGWTAECWSLPGVVSCGGTEIEAVDNCWEALAEVILSYRGENKEIPWTAQAETGGGP